MTKGISSKSKKKDTKVSLSKTGLNLHKKRSIWLAIGVIFHLIYLWSIFDIYFVSPLVHGMKQHKSTPNAPAKRLFLIVGDGQRADKTLGKIYHPGTGKEEFLAPYLRSIILKEGTYGLSHTRMPTESRPGHVAMIAGFYEDVSAVTKGWKENPVDFDSVFNQSTHTYSFGSPDILPMFAQGALNGKVDTWMYGHEFEDFTSSSIELDKYSFDHFYQLLKNSSIDENLNNQIKKDGNIFFLHLLGTDTAGHSYRPYSEEYYNNIQYTDKQIEKLVIEVNKFFNDEETAFIFTADHGMSDFGSHGDGHPNNTRTPLICWGKGCNKPVKINPKDNDYLYDDFEKEDMSNWYLDNIKRNDVKQADIASLMSYLVGLNYPMNSVGELPLSFIDDSENNKIKGLYQNSLSLLEQYIVKLHEVKDNQFNFKEFNKFQHKSIESYKNDIEKVINLMESNIELESEAILLIEDFNSVILEGLDYLQKYNWLMIRSIVTLGFIGWIIYSFTVFLQMFIIPHDKLSIDYTKKHYIQKFIFSSIGSIMLFIFKYENLPLNYYFYLLFPIFLWYEIFKFKTDLINGFNLFFKGLNITLQIFIFVIIIVFFGSIAIGFENRTVFSYIYLILSFTYPILLFKNTIFSTKKHILISFSWFITCISLSFFPIQNPVKVESVNMIVTSGLIMTIIGIVGFTFLQNKMTKITKITIISQILLIVLSIYSTLKAVVSLTNRDGLPIDAQIIGWGVLITSLIIPTISHCLNSNSNYKIRFLIIFLTLAPTFNILTISFEGLFYILYSIMIFEWIEIESMSVKSNNNLKLLRISIIGFFNLQISFFGTGNVSSISSFSLDSVYRLLPIFDPFPMGALLMLKLIIPYALLSTGLGLINLKLGFQKYSITSLIISVCDLLSLWFFYMVKTEGSWLDIGVSISNYCLAIFGALFIAIVEVGSTIVLSGVIIDEPINDKKLKVISNLKIDDDKYYKDIEKIINDEQLDDGSIGTRLRRRSQKVENID